jgi:nucleoside-diphosphate-sugar epimerase
MEVLVTGAGGNLGRVVVPALVEAGHTPKLFDFRPLQTEHQFVQGDVRSPDDVQRAVQGVQAIVHAAALHGIHLRKWQPQDYWDINVTGTFNMYEAARAHGISRFVLCSTMGVYGESMKPPEGAWGMVTEQSPTLPGDVYGMSKLLCEEMGRYYGRQWGINTVALRLGMFVPETFERYGFRLLFGGVDDRDVAQAVMLALNHTPQGGFDCFNIFADVPFSLQDAVQLHEDPLAVLDRYWPGTAQLVRERGLNVEELIWGRVIWPPDKARRVLGYSPRYNFGQFLEAFRRGDTSYYPFANLPHWGV